MATVAKCLRCSRVALEKIISNGTAFVAIKDDGGVVTWGDPEFGGDSSDAKDVLFNIVYDY